ncbi:MAG: M50 family metallopeptidase [Pseudomonadota bacterium]|nr:M50 family metallopeptidase [Pseudomonadota bacterium]
MSAIAGLLLGTFSFIFLISLVVVIHELGHYWAGRVCGVHAEAFSMGFGPTLWSGRDKHGTVWRVAAFPLGGYVKFLGDAGAASEPDAEKLAELRQRMGPAADKCYHFKPIWARSFITAAGPIANFILAIAIFATLALSIGGPAYQPAIVGSVTAGSAAEEAGFREGDEIIAINGNEITSFQEIITEVIWRPGQEIAFDITRGEQQVTLRATPRATEVEDEFGGTRTFGQLGLGNVPQLIRRDDYPLTPVGFVSAIGHGIDRTWSAVSMTGRYVGHIVTGRADASLLNGPLGIAEAAGQTAQRSVDAGRTPAESAFLLFINLVQLAGFLSVGLGLVNLLPIPILDGGHLVYYAYEAVARRPLSMKAQAIGFRLGLALVLMMMLLATWNDINYKLSQFF